MKMFSNFLIVLLIGLLLGGLSTQFSIRQSHGLGAINVGPWSAWPFVGGAEVDPYTSARATADGTLPLGAAEGLAFEANSDNGDNPLLRECTYKIAGNTPPSRFWTLAAYTPSGERIVVNDTETAATHSGRVLRFPDGSFLISASPQPKAGNWLRLDNTGPFKLILRLYDTPITSNSGVIDPIMPTITRESCPQ